MDNKINFVGIIPWGLAVIAFLFVSIFTGAWVCFLGFVVIAFIGCVLSLFMKKGMARTILTAMCVTILVLNAVITVTTFALGFTSNAIKDSGTSSSLSKNETSSESVCCDEHNEMCGTSRKDPTDDNKIKTWYCCEKCSKYKDTNITVNISGNDNEVNIQHLVFFGDVWGTGINNGDGNAAGATDSAMANAGDGVQNNGDENYIENIPTDVDDIHGDNNDVAGGKENTNTKGNENVVNSTTKASTTTAAPKPVVTTTTTTTKPAPKPETMTTTTKPAPKPETTTTTTKKPDQPKPETTTTTTKKPDQPKPETTTTTTTTKPAPKPEPKPVASVNFQRFDRNGTNYGDVSIYIENPNGEEVIDCGGLGTVRKISDNLYRVEVDLEEGATGSFVITVSGGNLEVAAQFVYAI